MQRPHVLLLEDDAALASALLEFFELEGIVTACCDSFIELKRRLGHDAECVIVADSWTSSAGAQLSLEQREQIIELGLTALGVIVTTGRAWAATCVDSEFGPNVVVMPKPYDLDQLKHAIDAAWARGRNRYPNHA